LQHGGGFPAVNGANNLSPFSPNIPTSLGPIVPMGPTQPGVYASGERHPLAPVRPR